MIGWLILVAIFAFYLGYQVGLNENEESKDE